MEIGAKNADVGKPTFKKVNELIPSELREAVHLNQAAPDWVNQQLADEGFNFPLIAHKHGNFGRCENEVAPDKEVPDALFDFELIINSRKFQVCLATLLRIKTSEDLTYFSEMQLKRQLELCASYKATCYSAYIAACREHRNWKMYNKIWMAEKRKEAQTQIRADRIADRAAGLRKEIGQVTAQELEDFIVLKYTKEYKENTNREDEWEENSKVYLELRDTIKDRGMHLQTLLKGVNDNTDPAAVSSGAQQ